MGRSDYLSYGGAEAARGLNPNGTRDYLAALGFGNGELAQARAAILARESEVFVFDAIGSRYCDFCFVQIMGGEYEELADGRDRCSRCSRSVLSTHEEFVREFEFVRRNMQLAFGISIGTPTSVKMVNAKEISRRTGEHFTPTAGVDPRVLGFATRTDNGMELFLENGAPRQAAITTMAHELTHIWQFANWSEGAIDARYGKKYRLLIFEGMATWAMVQYLFFVRDFEYARRQQAFALEREDEYGVGFQLFTQRYPIGTQGLVADDTPFRTAFPL